MTARREDEREISKLADALYRRVDWQWAQNGGLTVAHGWKPERGFLKSRWEGYSEAILLYVLGLGSPTHALPERSYKAWTRTYRWKKLYGHEFLYAGPLFIHQLSHVWIDFRGIRDDYMRERGIDYFENSRRATFAQQQYAIRNPKRFKGYGEYCWGITASDGPGPATRRIDGVERRFYDYKARSIPYGPDDGTDRPLGGGRLAAVRARDRAADDPAFPRSPPAAAEQLRLAVQLQPDLQGRVSNRAGLALVGLLRTRAGADRPDDRELPVGLPLEPDEAVSLPRHRTAPRRVSRTAGCRRFPERPPSSLYVRSCGQQVEHQPVMPRPIVPALVRSHDADWAKADPTIRPDGALVGRRRIDRQPVVPARFEEMARQGSNGVAAESLALVSRVEEQVDAGVAIVGVVLLGVLNAPDQDAIEFDREDCAIVGVEPVIDRVIWSARTPPARDFGLGQDLAEPGPILTLRRPQDDPLARKCRVS